MYDELSEKQDLMSSGGDERNWRGIGIALLVIFAVCALIVTAVVFLTPTDKGLHLRNARISLKEVIGGSFDVKKFNGSWISDTEYIYQDMYQSVVLYNVETRNISVLMPNISYNQHFVEKYSLSPDRKYLLISLGIQKIYRYTFTAKYQIYNISSDMLSPISAKEPPLRRYQYAKWGTRGNQLVYVYENNIFYLPNLHSVRPTPLSHTGIPGTIFNGIPDWLYEEEILASDNAIWWSPDGTKLCYATFNDTEVGIVTYPWYGSYGDSNNLYPETVEVRYPKANTKNPVVRLSVVDLDNFVPQQIHPPREYADRDYYITSVQWIDSSRLAVVWLQRLQNSSLVTFCQFSNKGWWCEKNMQIDSQKSGWVSPNKELIFSNDTQYYFMYLPKSEGWLGNFQHVAMINTKNGSSKQFLTGGHFEVIRLLTYHKEYHAVYYISTIEDRSGERHLFSVTDLTAELPKKISCLTCDMGKSCLFNNAIFSPGGKYYILECLGPGIPRIELRKTEGNELKFVINGNENLEMLISKRTLPQVRSFQVALTSGYKANVRLFLPPALKDDEITKYPMVVNVYGGPGDQMVTEKFNIHWGTYLSSKKNYIYTWIDGRGSGNRGQKMLHEIYRRLGSVEVDDQIAVTRYLKSALPFIDNDRVAIWGWSYGGYVSAMALATDDNVFTCGMSVAPVTSWRYYDSFYTERYMQFPDTEEDIGRYERANLMKIASNLQGKRFLLVHGTADDNVHIQQSMMLIKALTDFGIIFRTQIYPDENHILPHVTSHLHWTLEDFLEQCFSSDYEEDIDLQEEPVVSNAR